MSMARISKAYLFLYLFSGPLTYCFTHGGVSTPMFAALPLPQLSSVLHYTTPVKGLTTIGTHPHSPV